MTPTVNMLSSWIRLTWGGWVLGVPVIAALALAGEVVGIGGSQVLVGAGMGLAVGAMQGIAVRRIGVRAAPWIVACFVGLAAPFLAADLQRLGGIEHRYSLPLAVALGGLVAGAAQSVLLRPRFHSVVPWVVGSFLGWSLAGVAAGSADSLMRAHAIRGIWGALGYLGLVALGGLVLGVVTGMTLAWMLKREAVG